MSLDATELAPRLAQGSAPRSAEDIRRAGFQVVVFAAAEVQPPDHVLVGLEALRCPLTDDPTRPVTAVEWQAACACADAVVRRWHAGRTVLVTCAQGRNRSGLISALALIRSGRLLAPAAVRLIQGRRAFALTNPRFVEALLSQNQAK